jgi:hypothetical protein
MRLSKKIYSSKEFKTQLSDYKRIKKQERKNHFLIQFVPNNQSLPKKYSLTYKS